MKWFWIVLCIVLAGFGAASGWFYAAQRARSPEAVRGKCISRLEELGRALEKYASENEGELPAKLTDLYPGYIDDPKECERPVPRGSVSPKEYRYDYRATPDTDFIVLVVYDPPGSHEAVAMGPHAACMRKGRFIGVRTLSDDEIRMLAALQDYAFDYVKNGTQSALQGLLDIMNESEGNVRDAAADVLRVAVKPQTPRLLVGELGREEVQDEAARLLTSIGKDALDDLIRACDDPNPSVRAGAIRSLGDIGDESAVSIVFGKLTDTDAGVRVAAANSLGKMAPAKVISLLTDALSQGDPVEQQRIIEILPDIGESLVPQLRAMLERGDTRSRQGAAFILGKLKAETAVPALGRATRDGDWNVAWYAAQALAEIGNEDCRDYLIALLDVQLRSQGMVNLHHIGVIGLGTIGGDQVRAKLREVLMRESEPHEVRSAAAYYLGELQDREAVPLLIETMANFYYL
ncbi:MAG: HEAT repeat domain-containing protein, partial [Candidatus Hydrogenedentes bacterium]|nr:HEAT repeat domain-containing protein [Candidatus Hydrogenedentota bacterium]